MTGIGESQEVTQSENAQAQAQAPAQASIEINDLGDALQFLREDNTQVAQGDLAGEQVPGGEHQEAQPQESGSGAAAEGTVEPGGMSVDSGAEGSSGGLSTSAQGYDYSATEQELIKQAQSAAVQRVGEKFRQQKIKQWDISDIYKSDPDSGVVTFVNPDDPNHPFASRAEAQNWINAMNTQINAKFRQEVTQELRGIVKELEPTRRLLAFAPTYEAMDDDVREAFDSLIDPYSVTNEDGEVIGFSCDLTRAAATAEAMVSKFRSKYTMAAQAATVPEPTTPSLDIKGRDKGDTGATDLNREPKDIEDAMRLLQEQKAASRKKN